MASYIPAQRTGAVWESQYASPKHRPGIAFPEVRSGSQRDYSGHHSGAPEFDMPTLGHLAGEVKHQLGNLLLYGRLWDSEHPKGTTEEAPAAEETPEPLAVPGARQPLAVAAGEPVTAPPSYRFGGAPGYPIGRTPWMAQQEAVPGVPRAPWTEAAQVSSGIAAAGRNIPIAARLNTVARPPLNLLEQQPVARVANSRTQRRAAGANLSRIKQDPPMDYRIKG